MHHGEIFENNCVVGLHVFFIQLIGKTIVQHSLYMRLGLYEPIMPMRLYSKLANGGMWPA